MAVQFSDAVKVLIQKARMVSFEAWRETHPVEAIALFQAADDQGRYLSDSELQQLRQLAPNVAASLPVAQLLRDQVADIVTESRAQVLDTFPTLTQPGGGLYPAERADACWRDFWHFLRCITYGIAGEQVNYTSSEGLHYMRLLYRELQVPLDAMVVGLEGIKSASLKRIPPELAPNSPDRFAPYFDHLIDQMRQFQDGLGQSN